MAGPSGPIGGGGHIPFSAEWLKKASDLAKKQATGKTDAEEASETTSLSARAQSLAITKEEKMLETMKAELSKLNPESESFMEEATGKLVDSVIDQEYGEGFKKKSGYENLQDKLINTVLSNEASREAVADFFELLLIVEERDDDLDDEDEHDEEGEDSEEYYEDEESFEEE